MCMASSDVGKYLKTLAIIIAFAEYIWNFGIWRNLEVFKTWYRLGKTFPQKIAYIMSRHG